jgi:hypothetical protein
MREEVGESEVRTEKSEPAHRVMYARLRGRVKAQP